MFWRFNYSTSQLQTLLEKEDVTLKEILDEEDVLQECKSNNDKLINFLIEEQNLEELVANVINPGTKFKSLDDPIESKDFFKYPMISCELLTCDIQQINDALIGNAKVMNQLYDYMKEDRLNPVLTSYFVKIVNVLINKNTEKFLEFIQAKEDFLKLFFKHLNTSSIIDVIRILLTIDSSSGSSSSNYFLSTTSASSANKNSDLAQGAIKWLKEVRLIDGLVDVFSAAKVSDYDEYELGSVYSNVTQLITDLIKITREQIFNVLDSMNINVNANTSEINSDSNEDTNGSTKLNETITIESNKQTIASLIKNSILEQIENEETINKLLTYMFESNENTAKHPNADPTVFIIEILLNMIDSGPTISYNFTFNETEQDKFRREKDKLEISANATRLVLECCSKRVKSFNDAILNAKPKYECIQLSNGSKINSLGMARLSIIKLISKLISINDETFNRELIKLETIKIIIDMSFEFRWNNFLHSQLVEIIKNCFDSDLKRNEQSDTDISDDEPDKDVYKHSFIQHFLVDCKLINKLIKAWNEYFNGLDNFNENQIKYIKTNSAGYIGHFTVISNLFNNNQSKYIQNALNQLLDSETLNEWKELSSKQIHTLNNLHSKDLVRNPLAINANDSSLSQSELTSLPDDEKMSRKLIDLKQEIKISCSQDFSVSDSSSEWSSVKTKSSFFISSGNEGASLFEQMCSQREHNMNFDNSASNQMDDDVWVTREIKFANENDNPFDKKTNISGNSIEDKNFFAIDDINDNAKSDTFNFKNKMEITSDSSSDSGSSSDDDEQSNDIFKNKSRKKRDETPKFDEDPGKSITFSNDDPFESNMPEAANAKEETANPISPLSPSSSSSSTAANSVLTDNDPWSGIDPFASADATNQTETTKTEKSDQNWANFDNI